MKKRKEIRVSKVDLQRIPCFGASGLMGLAVASTTPRVTNGVQPMLLLTRKFG
jgi:hypothetical protein